MIPWAVPSAMDHPCKPGVKQPQVPSGTPGLAATRQHLARYRGGQFLPPWPGDVLLRGSAFSSQPQGLVNVLWYSVSPFFMSTQNL